MKVLEKKNRTATDNLLRFPLPTSFYYVVTACLQIKSSLRGLCVHEAYEECSSDWERWLQSVQSQLLFRTG
jgi:hypothetical protein